MVRWAQPTTGRVAAAAALLWGGKSLQTLHCGASLTCCGAAEAPGAFIWGPSRSLFCRRRWRPGARPCHGGPDPGCCAPWHPLDRGRWPFGSAPELAFGAEGDIIAYLISRYFGLRSFGAAVGFAFGAFVLAGGTGPLLMDFAFDHSGSYTVPFAVAFLLTLLAGWLLTRLGPYRFGVNGKL